jgi:WD40 repeat protein
VLKWPLPSDQGILVCPRCRAQLYAKIPTDAGQADALRITRWTHRLVPAAALGIAIFGTAALFANNRRSVTQVAYSPDGDTLAVTKVKKAGPDQVQMLDAASGLYKDGIDIGARSSVHSVFAPDGKTLALAVVELGPGRNESDRPRIGSLRLWDFTQRREISSFRGQADDFVLVAFLDGGNLILTVSTDKTVSLWALGFLKGQTTYTLPNPVHRAAVTPDGETLAASDRAGNVTLVEVRTGKIKAQIAGGNDTVAAIALFPDGKSLAVAGTANGQVVIRDVVSGQTKAILSAPMDWLTCLAISGDGRRLAVGGGRYRQPGQIKVFDLTINTEERTLEIATNTVKSVAFSPDGKRLAAGGAPSMDLFTKQRSGQWYEWDLESGNLIAAGE